MGRASFAAFVAHSDNSCSQSTVSVREHSLRSLQSVLGMVHLQGQLPLVSLLHDVVSLCQQVTVVGLVHQQMV